MKVKKWAQRIAVVLLCVPVGYLAVRDVVVYTMLATNSLVHHEHVMYQSDVEKDLTEGEDEGLTACSVIVKESWRGASVVYPVSCDMTLSGRGDVGVVPGIFSDEVVTLDGQTIWHGEPSEQLYFITAVLYAVSYGTVLYVLSRWYLRRQPQHKINPSVVDGLATMTTPLGLVVCYALLLLVVPLFNGDPMLALLVSVVPTLWAGRGLVRVANLERPITPAD